MEKSLREKLLEGLMYVHLHLIPSIHTVLLWWNSKKEKKSRKNSDWQDYNGAGQDYRRNHDKHLTVNAAATMISRILYGKRFFPYYTQVILGGLDEEGTYTMPPSCSLDSPTLPLPWRTCKALLWSNLLTLISVPYRYWRYLLIRLRRFFWTRTMSCCWCRRLACHAFPW